MLKQQEIHGEKVILGANGALVASNSEPGGWHVVRDGACDCLGFVNHGHCRHVRAVALLEIPVPTTAPAVQPAAATRSVQAAPGADALLAGPEIDPPLFPPTRPHAPKPNLAFEEIFRYYA